MSNQDWEKFGEDIRRTVQDAVDSQDFNKLNQTITNTINNAMDGLEKGIHSVEDVVDKTAWNLKNQPWNRGNYDFSGDGYRYDRRKRREEKRFQRDFEREAAREQRAQNRYERKSGGYQAAPDFMDSGRGADSTMLQKAQGLFARTTGAKAGGIALSVVGYTLGGGMLVCSLILLLVSFMAPGLIGNLSGLLAGLVGIAMLSGVVMTGIGRKRLGKVRRFRAYVRELEGKDYCEIKELAASLKKSEKYVIKDIEKLIDKGWFLQGHLDEQKTCLIASDEAYEQYKELMRHLEQEKRDEALAKERQAQAQETERTDPQVQEILRAGDEYIKKIRACNDAIVGAEISAKISRMETLIDRIFDRVEQNQENVPDVRRLMEYYLPTTVKLLEAYEELDAQPVQGENIISSKLEIEKTLDTLNTAFEKLLDSMFQDTAWNVSADISVLKTMLAQEGLAKDDFK